MAPNNGDIELDLATLRSLIGAIVDAIEIRYGDQITLHDEPYWSIPAEQRTDVYSNPRDLTIGQLSDSIRNLENLRDEPAGFAPAVHLADLAEVLRSIANAAA